MAEHIKIKVHPSGTSSDLLTVADAMRQVLDVIELLEAKDPSEPGSPEKIIWRLAYATTNSPFEIGAEATAKDPSLSIGIKARMAKLSVESFLGGLLDTDSQSTSHFTFEIDEADERIVSRILARNVNGIGRTDLDFGLESPPTTIVHINATMAQKAIEANRLFREGFKSDLTRTEYGAFEGEIISAGMFHNSPAVTVRHRLTLEKVTCVFPPELAFRIGSEHNWHEVWAGRRVLVHGALHYDKEGDLKKVDALDIESIEERAIDLRDARRIDLLEGFSVSEFLDRSWGATDE